MKHYTVGHYSDKPSPWAIVLMLVIGFLCMLSDNTWEKIATWILRVLGVC